MSETFLFERSGPVGWLRINRADRLNAFTLDMWVELAQLGAVLRDDPDLRALVVIGEGRAFSSGIDTASFAGAGGGGPFAQAGSGGETSSVPGEDPLVEGIADLQATYAWLAEAPYPTIAAVRGFALGGGCQLALACDLRVVARGTKFGLPEHKYGLLPDLGGTFWLTRIVGPAKAKELIWTAATFDADEADRLGLVNRLVDDEELEAAAGELAQALAAQPPIAVRGTKRAVDAATRQTLAEGLREAAVGQAACIRSADFIEAVTAFAGRRPPTFQNR